MISLVMAIGLLAEPSKLTGGQVNRVFEIEAAARAATAVVDGEMGAEMDLSSYNDCSSLDYRACVSACVDDNTIPWRRLQNVSCWYNWHNRSYYMVACECNYVDEIGGWAPPKHTPIDVGGGLGF